MRNAIKSKPKLSTEISDKERAALERWIRSLREEIERAEAIVAQGEQSEAHLEGCIDLADGKEVEWAGHEDDRDGKAEAVP